MTDTRVDISFTLDERGEDVVVHGVAREEVASALELYRAARNLQGRTTSALEEQLVAAMQEVAMPALPPASQAQVQRSLALRERLLAQGTHTNASLAALRGDKESSLRTWVARARRQHRLFTVKVDGAALVPAVQLTDEGTLRPEISALVAELAPTGLDGWSLWAWLTSPTERLSGEIPAEVAGPDPQRALAAARRYARQLGSPAPA